MVLLALDLHLVHHGMIFIITPAWHQGPWHLHLDCPSNYNISHGYDIQHAGHK